MAVQRGRRERRGESYFVPYVEPLRDARTKLADFFSILRRCTLPRLSGGRLTRNAPIGRMERFKSWQDCSRNRLKSHGVSKAPVRVFVASRMLSNLRSGEAQLLEMPGLSGVEMIRAENGNTGFRGMSPI